MAEMVLDEYGFLEEPVYRVIKPVLMIFSMNGIVTKKNAHTRQKMSIRIQLDEHTAEK